MQIDVKAAVILLITLLLGIALGAVGTGAISRGREGQVQELREPRGFVSHMHDVIRPRDDAQRMAMDPVIEATARINDSLIHAANDQLRGALDSMRAQLDPMLDPEQRNRLGAIGRLPDPFRGPPGPDGRRPPPRGGPPPERGDGRRPPPGGGPR